MKTPPWLCQLLDQPEITDICLNGALGIFVDRGNGMQPHWVDAPWTERELKDWVIQSLSNTGKSWDARYPFCDLTLPSGHRMHVAFPPLVEGGISVSIRRMGFRCATKRWTESKAEYEIIQKSVQNGDSVIISGATGSGKTTLLNDLLGEIPSPDRIIGLQDTPELSPDHPHFVSMTSRPPNADGCGEVTLTELLRQCLRMRPDRIILGECRGKEVLDLLQALNTGHRGAMATVHANSGRDALRRIELLCLLGARGTVPVAVIRDLLSNGVQWLVHVEKHGRIRRISEILRIEGKERDTILVRPMIDKGAP